jgi:hypothetical protein
MVPGEALGELVHEADIVVLETLEHVLEALQRGGRHPLDAPARRIHELTERNAKRACDAIQGLERGLPLARLDPCQIARADARLFGEALLRPSAAASHLRDSVRNPLVDAAHGDRHPYRRRRRKAIAHEA